MPDIQIDTYLSYHMNLLFSLFLSLSLSFSLFLYAESNTRHIINIQKIHTMETSIDTYTTQQQTHTAIQGTYTHTADVHKYFGLVLVWICSARVPQRTAVNAHKSDTDTDARRCTWYMYTCSWHTRVFWVGLGWGLFWGGPA